MNIKEKGINKINKTLISGCMIVLLPKISGTTNNSKKGKNGIIHEMAINRIFANRVRK